MSEGLNNYWKTILINHGKHPRVVFVKLWPKMFNALIDNLIWRVEMGTINIAFYSQFTNELFESIPVNGDA